MDLDDVLGGVRRQIRKTFGMREQEETFVTVTR